jgi:hypothetical protein
VRVGLQVATPGEGDFCPLDGSTYQPAPHGRPGRFCGAEGHPDDTTAPPIDVRVRRPDGSMDWVPLAEVLALAGAA